MNTNIGYTENYSTNNNISINENDINHSKKGYDSTLAPFFRQYIDDDNTDIKSDSIIPDTDYTSIDTINLFINLCDNKDIQDFFINNKAVDREIYIKEWTFFSVEKILSLNEMYKVSNINNIIDLGYIYYGMGWVIVAFYYITDKKIYARMDGGSNNYDRVENFNNLKKIDSVLLDKTTGMFFHDFLNKVKNDYNTIPPTVM